MNYLAYLILRRLRLPLLLLIVVYAVCVLGYTLIPGQDADGNPQRMSFFHAFYFVSFMASTIGFGEIPHEFTNAQRLWTLFAIYATVIGWLFSIGSLVALFRDEAFLRLVRRTRFSLQVEGLQEPFYLVCGYGVTGSRVVARLTHRGVRCVVIDIDPQRVEALDLDNLPIDVPHLCADAEEPDVLQDAGIESVHCIGVLCLTNQDHVNLAIAITSKLLVPNRLVISRTATRAYARNLASFGTDYIIDPFEIYADYLDMAIHHPYRHLIYDWLINPRHQPISLANRDKHGTWIVCGYGRFGRALKKRFDRHDSVQTVIVDPDPKGDELGEQDTVVAGLGTEARTLEAACIAQARGIIAGTDDDANNLSIVMTARALRPALITVARQNKHTNQPVFAAAPVDLVMNPSRIMSNNILALLKTPLMMLYITQLQQQSEAWCEALIKELEGWVGGNELDCWSFDVNRRTAPAVYEQLRHGHAVTLEHLLGHPHDRSISLPAKVLMVRRDGQEMLSPVAGFGLRIDDSVLLCGLRRSANWMDWSLKNENVLHYLLTGDQGGGGFIWRRLHERRKRRG